MTTGGNVFFLFLHLQKKTNSDDDDKIPSLFLFNDNDDVVATKIRLKNSFN